MVFAREAAPEGREAFMGWFHKITKWGEEHDYDDPAYTSPKLRDWYGDMVSVFPAMNGPDGVADDHPALSSDHVTDYTCARDAIHAGWNVAEEAYYHTFMYAAIHKVGFFDVSASKRCSMATKRERLLHRARGHLCGSRQRARMIKPLRRCDQCPLRQSDQCALILE